jgi:hypothetical protein
VITPSSVLLAFLGAPWQVAVVLLLVVGLFAPQLLPRFGRMLGRMIRSEAFRRLGLPTASSGSSSPPRNARPPQEQAPTPAIEVLMPEHPAPTLRTHSDRSLVPRPTPARTPPLWLVGTGVLAVAGAIFWLLLHSR